jgi:hypothetical protein
MMGFFNNVRGAILTILFSGLQAAKKGAFMTPCGDCNCTQACIFCGQH